MGFFTSYAVKHACPNASYHAMQQPSRANRMQKIFTVEAEGDRQAADQEPKILG